MQQREELLWKNTQELEREREKNRVEINRIVENQQVISTWIHIFQLEIFQSWNNFQTRNAIQDLQLKFETERLAMDDRVRQQKEVSEKIQRELDRTNEQLRNSQQLNADLKNQVEDLVQHEIKLKQDWEAEKRNFAEKFQQEKMFSEKELSKRLQLEFQVEQKQLEARIRDEMTQEKEDEIEMLIARFDEENLKSQDNAVSESSTWKFNFERKIWRQNFTKKKFCGWRKFPCGKKNVELFPGRKIPSAKIS